MNRLFYEIQKQIEAGKYKLGQVLPSVEELRQEFGATADEVEQALSELIYEGIIERVRPEPTEQVRVPNYELWGTLTGIHSITKEAKKRGQEPGVEILSYAEAPAWPAIAERLGLEEGDKVVMMERYRKADGKPVAIEISYYPAKLYPGINEAMFTGSGSGQSSFKVMQEKFGLIPHHAKDEVTLVSLEKREADLLGLDVGQPVLLRFRVTYSEKGTPIKASRAVWKFKAGYEMDL